MNDDQAYVDQQRLSAVRASCEYGEVGAVCVHDGMWSASLNGTFTANELRRLVEIMDDAVKREMSADIAQTATNT